MHAALLRHLPCSSVPRSLTSISASTSGSTSFESTAGASHLPHPPRPHHQQHSHQQQHLQQQRRCSHIVRITGKREEYVLDGVPDPEDVWGEDADGEFIEVDTMPIWSPEKGPIGTRIFRDADEEKEKKEISIEDTAYWFADSQGIDLPRTQWHRTAPETEGELADEMLYCPDILKVQDGAEGEEGEELELPPRLRLTDLEEGDELVGVVTDLWLWHGAFVDVLAEYKGLIPIRQAEWPDVEDYLPPGTEVVVKVHKLSDFPKYRFPIQLELLEPSEAVPLIMAPHEYEVPANVGWLYDQGLDIQEVAAELGRPYEDTVAILEPDHDDWQDTLSYEFGYDAIDGNPYPGDWITREILEEPAMQELVQEMAVNDAGALATVAPGPEEGSWGI